MTFQGKLAEKKSKIVARWIEAVLASYSADGASFFNRQKDRFANPLGFAAKTGLTAIYDQLVGDAPAGEMPAELAQFVKLRSVQTFTPSQAVGFVFQLKPVLVEQLGWETLLAAGQEWSELAAKIDRLALKLFDLYVEDRELLHEVKLSEYKKGNHILAAGRCPSSALGGNSQAERVELKVIRDC